MQTKNIIISVGTSEKLHVIHSFSSTPQVFVDGKEISPEIEGNYIIIEVKKGQIFTFK